MCCALPVTSVRVHDTSNTPPRQVLKCVQPLTLDTLCTGQYVRCGNSPGYLEEPTVVDKQSRTETFAAAVLHVHNPRWEGVPFVLKVCPPL